MSKEPVSYKIDLDKIEEYNASLLNKKIRELQEKSLLDYSEEEIEGGYAYSSLLSLKRMVSYPELSELFSKLSDENISEFSEEERSFHLNRLINSLKQSVNCMKNIENTQNQLEDFPEDFSDRSNLERFLNSVKRINSNARELAPTVADATLLLLSNSSPQDIRESIQKNLANYSQEIARPINLDFIRNGVIVRKGEDVQIFRNKEALYQWGASNGLSGEQIELAINLVDQATGTGWSSVPTSLHAKKVEGNKPIAIASAECSIEPTSFIDITDDNKVTLTSNFRSDVVVATEFGVPKTTPNTSISTVTMDITQLKGDHFTPGLPSSGPMKIDTQLSFLRPDILSASVPSFLSPEGPTTITAHIKDYAKIKIRGACELKPMLNLFLCSQEELKSEIISQLASDERFSSREKIVETFKKAIDNLHPDIDQPGEIMKSILEVSNSTGFKKEFQKLFELTFSKLSTKDKASAKEFLISHANTIKGNGPESLQKRYNILSSLDKILSPEEGLSVDIKNSIELTKSQIQKICLKRIEIASKAGSDAVIKELKKTSKYFSETFGNSANEEMMLLRKNILSESLSVEEAINVISGLRLFEEEKGLTHLEFNVSKLAAIAKNSVQYGISESDLPSISEQITSLFKAAYGEEANLEPKEFILNTAKEKGFRVRSGLFGLFSVQASEDSELLAHDPSLILKLEFIKKTPTISRSRSEEIERTSLIRDTFATQAVKPNSPERGVIKKENKPRSLSF